MTIMVTTRMTFMAKTMVVAMSVVASLQSALFVCPPSLPPSPSPVFGHLVVIIKILNVAMIKAFSRKDANSQLLLRGDEK